MIDASNGIAVGDPVGGKWTVLKTTDGGGTWARIATRPAQVGQEAGWNNALAVYGSTNIWFGTDSAKVYSFNRRRHDMVVEPGSICKQRRR